MKKFSFVLALAMLIGFGTVTTMTYAGDPPAPTGEKEKDKKSAGPKATEDEKKEDKKDGGR
jgi:hypothetical protein